MFNTATITHPLRQLARLTLLALACSGSAWAQAPQPSTQAVGTTLLQRALQCELPETEVGPLIKTLAQLLPEFRRPAARHFMPAADVYRLRSPIEVHGHPTRTVVVARMRILGLVAGLTAEQAAEELKLTRDEAPLLAHRRQARPGAEVTAECFDHPGLKGKLLLGCGYDVVASADWVPEFKSKPVGRDQRNPLYGWMD